MQAIMDNLMGWYYEVFLRDIGFRHGFTYLYMHSHIFFEMNYFLPISIILNFKELFSDLNFITGFGKSVIIILLKGMFYDIILYSFGLLLGYIKPFRNIIYDNKKLFFIYFRYIPFLGNFGAFFGGMLTDKVDIWRDFKLLLYGNLLAIIIYGIIGDAITIMWGEGTLDGYNPSFD
ncbi:hypothetical protein BKN14_05230 [Candidatus Gracilibacteria bacterium HOT-871]|nr:hypothetical protein BKN14_05230 [Candidatus Gracilibacteria bacterium HOT-871]